MKIEKDGNGWTILIQSVGVPMSCGNPRIEVSASGESRLVVELLYATGTVLRDQEHIPQFPRPLDVTEQLSHAVRELASAACEMTAAARTLRGGK